MDELRLHQLTKEMVAEELRRLGDPCAAAAAIVRKSVGAALKNLPEGTEASRVVEDGVKGAMTALLLADQSLPRGGMLVLEAVLAAADEAHADPTETMRAALLGMADLRRFADPARIEEIHAAIEAKYMGAGEVFVEFLRAPVADGRPAPRAAA
jgi:hypothetical protein